MAFNSNIIETFFLLVRAGLFGRTEGIEVFLPDGVDWAEVYQLAKEQSMVGLIADGIEVVQTEWQKTHNTPLMPREWILKFAHVALQQEQRNLNMNKFVAELINKLQEKGNYPLLLKGQGVAQCYRNPLRRACGDVDLLLTEEDYQKTKDYLLPFSSFSKDGNEYKKELIIQISRWVVELHGSLRCGFSSRIDRELDKIYHDTFSNRNVRSWMNGKVQVFMLGQEDEVFYVFVHFLNHFYKSGVGIRQICDWCRLLWTFKDSLDVNALESRLKKMKLMSEWRAFGMFAVKYLGMPEEAIPFYCEDEKWKRKARQILAFILKTGNMGNNRKEKGKVHSYLSRKMKSSEQRICDLANHFTIFPMDTLRFFPRIFLNGLHQK